MAQPIVDDARTAALGTGGRLRVHDSEDFEQRISSGGFLEWTEFLGNYYGTPTPDAGDERDIVLEIEVDGAQQVKRIAPDAMLIFVLPAVAGRAGAAAAWPW